MAIRNKNYWILSLIFLGFLSSPPAAGSLCRSASAFALQLCWKCSPGAQPASHFRRAGEQNHYASRLQASCGRGTSAHFAFANSVSDADAHADKIRHARLDEKIDLQFNLSTPVNHCKYESSIGTPPPHMKVALTFDDGPDAVATPYILEVLEKFGVRATFFMIGETASAHMSLVQKVSEAGHLIVGNHSWTHPNFHTLSVDAQKEEIQKNESLLGPYQSPKLFRYPYGNSTCEANTFVHSLGYQIVGWHVDSCDWAFNKTGSVDANDASICEVKSTNRGNFIEHVVSSLKAQKGGILLMHEIQHNTIQKLETIIDQLKEVGFEFGALDEKDFQPSLR